MAKVFLILCLLFLWFGLAAASTFASDKANVVVAADGSGDVKTISEAIGRVPENNQRRFVIFVESGVYQEQIKIPADKPFVSLIGGKKGAVKLMYNIANKEAGSTSAAFAFYVAGHDFYAENITFENSFGVGSQAVAVLSEADRAVFRNCRFLGWQDTLYVRRGRQFYKDCYIEGSVDFIFGQAAAVFESCQIHSKTDGYIAAPMRFGANEKSGLIFIKCLLTAENSVRSVYLGRPWRDFGRTVFLETKLDAPIKAEGWHHWLPEREKTAYFAEYLSNGKGANSAARVKWSHQLLKAEAEQFYTENFLRGEDRWNPRKIVQNSSNRTPYEFKVIAWQGVFNQIPLWYPTDEAVTIANQVLAYQKANGGWEKNIDNAELLTAKEKAAVLQKKSEITETTIDNRTSYTQINFLGKVITGLTNSNPKRTEIPVFKEAFDKGFDYLISAQYENGGFPQFFPLKRGYYSHITFNDDALIGVLNVLRDISLKNEDYVFVDEERRLKAAAAIRKALPILLATQIKINGKKTVWSQQYDENTLMPVSARAFEPVALTASESVGIVRYLMSIENPSDEIINAVESAVDWFRKNQLKNIRWKNKNLENVVVEDKSAPPIWARFYQIETMKPIFVRRDSVIKYDISQIEAERRNGYAWYVSTPRELLEKDYPKWKEKIKKN